MTSSCASWACACAEPVTEACQSARAQRRTGKLCAVPARDPHASPPELLTYGAGCLSRTSKVRLAQLAARQAGLVTWAQLEALRLAPATIRWWVASGYLIRVMPRVYAVGHQDTDERSKLFSLILFAGPHAALSHATSAHWRGWLRYRPDRIHISTPRRIRARVEGVAVHGCRDVERELVNGIPCTTVNRTLLDLAATESVKLVKRSLAQLDYERRLRPDRIREACGRGRAGSATLLTALNAYVPQLARTRSDLEDEYLYLCQRFSIPLPEVNACIHGEELDCLWRDLGIVVELDGGANHRSTAQRHRDERKALKLRARGLTVVRYSEDQVFNSPGQVAADTIAQLEQRRRIAS